VSVMPVLMFFAVTSTHGIKAPEASETVPLKTAFTCANACLDASSDSTNVAVMTYFFIGTSTFFFGRTLSRHSLQHQDVKYMNHIANVSGAKRLSRKQQQWLTDIVFVLSSYSCVRAFRDYLGLDSEEAGKRVAWAIRLLSRGATSACLAASKPADHVG